MGESPEYLTLINMRQQMRIGFKKNLVELASSFHREGLIDDSCYEEVSQVRSFLTDSEKAEEIIRRVTDSVQLSPYNFRKMIDILQLHSRFYGPLIEKLLEEFTVKQKGGYLPGLTMQQSSLTTPDYRSSKLWDTKLTESSLRYLGLLRYNDRRICEKKELRIIADLAPDWQMIGDILGFPPHRLRSIGRIGSRKAAEMCMRDTFLAWIVEDGKYNYDCTWKGVHNLLKDCLHEMTAKRLVEAIESGNSDLHLEGGMENSQLSTNVPQQQTQSSILSGKRKKLNKRDLAAWLTEQGVDEEDVDKMKERGVNEMLFLNLERGDSYLDGVSEVTLRLLDSLKTELKQM